MPPINNLNNQGQVGIPTTGLPGTPTPVLPLSTTGMIPAIPQGQNIPAQRPESPDILHFDILSPYMEKRDIVSVRIVDGDETYRQIKLDDEEKQELEKEIATRLTEWENATGNLRTLLKEWNDSMENIVESKTFPWDDCSNLSIPIVPMYSSIIHSTMRSTILDAYPIFYFRSSKPSEQRKENVIEELLQWVIRGKPKMENDIDDLLQLAIRDGVAIGFPDWEQQIDTLWETEEFDDAVKFTEKYPDTIAFNTDDETYNKAIRKLLETGKLKIETEFEALVKDNPKLNVIELNNFVWFPATAIDLSATYCKGFGHRKTGIMLAELRRGEEEGRYFDVDNIASSAPDGNTEEQDTVRNSQESAEGISKLTENVNTYTMYQLIYRCKIGNDRMEKPYLIDYCSNDSKIHSLMRYPFEHNRICAIPFYINKRARRFLHKGIPFLLTDIRAEINTQHNQRIDGRSITNVPSFKGLNRVKEQIDEQGWKFYPGKIYWLQNNIGDIEQFQIRPADMGESIQEENNLMRFSELLTGATQIAGGREVSFDPRASGKKIGMLLAQSNLRLDDYIFYFSQGLVELAIQIIGLYRQFGPDQITIGRQTAVESNGASYNSWQPMGVNKKDLKLENGFLQLNHMSILQNPDVELSKMIQILNMATMTKDPLMAADEQRWEMWDTILEKGRFGNRRRLLPSLEELKPKIEAQRTQQAQMQTEAMKAQMMFKLMEKSAGKQPATTKVKQ